MLGLQDNSIFAAYMLSVFSALGCIVYGMLNWNKGGDNEVKQIQRSLKIKIKIKALCLDS